MFFNESFFLLVFYSASFNVKIDRGVLLKVKKLKYQLIIPTVIIVFILMSINIVLVFQIQQKQAVNELKEKGLALTQQLDSTWEFLSINQHRINTSAKGDFDFKGLNCSTAGMSIGVIFAEKNGYKIRYVNTNPRNPLNEPDPFEKKVLEKFSNDTAIDSYWELVKEEGQRYFCYVTPMRIDETCLECHGEPAGEMDISGYAKEGMKIGDLAGAISITMPTTIQDQALVFNMFWQCMTFTLLIIGCVLAIYYFVTKRVTKPIEHLETAVKQVGEGDLNVDLQNLRAAEEIEGLAEHFDNMAKQLKELYSDLEHKVELRTSELGKANEQLQIKQIQLEKVNTLLKEDSQYKADFLAMVSHELRTPLTAIIIFAEILLKKKRFEDSSEEQILCEIKENSEVLLHMINNILDLARLETGRNSLSIETVDLVDVINNVECVIRPLAQRNDIHLTARVERGVPLIQGDYEKVRRIIENLAGNAIKFTPLGGKVAIQASLAEDPRYVKITVQDNGIGISKENQAHIFEKFIQVDSSSSRQYNGSGLGLALAKELTELHGGVISVESDLNKGSTFIVLLPIERPQRGDAE